MNNNFPAGIRDNTRNTSMNLPVAIDYPAALALRQMALVQDELPKYLLAPEVSALLHYVPDLTPQDAAGDAVEHTARALMKRSR